MEYGFDVYEHVSGKQVGISKTDGKAVIATISPAATFKLEKKSLTLLSQTVSKLVRSGYKKLPRIMYLNTDAGKATFIKTNPDLSGFELGELILFVRKPLNISHDVFEDWQQQIEKLSPSWSLAEKWLLKLEGVNDCMAAFDGHPVMVLLLAQWACSNNMQMFSSIKNMPRNTPKADPVSWAAWLKDQFTEQQMNKCASDLGMSFKDLMKNNFSGMPDNNNSEAENDWFQSLEQTML